MFRPAARLRALAGALCCALMLCAAPTHHARADDSTMRPAAAAEPAGGRLAAPATDKPRHARRLSAAVSRPTRGVSLVGVEPALAAKARQIVAACGSRVVSAVRRTRVAGTGRMSEHAFGRAVDLQGAPACIYRALRGWPGGVSTDYATAPGGPHVHVSAASSREAGLRFAHRRGRALLAARRVHPLSEG